MVNKVLNHNKRVFFILLLLLITSKLITLMIFGVNYTGNDDLIYWHMANDLSKGIFHEPFFYGQNYNFPIEAYLSIPFLWLGISPWVALPMTTTLVSLFPFLLFSIVLFRRNRVFASYIFLLIPTCMPLEYDMITTISRGFTNGIFFCGFLVFPLLKPQKASSFFILGICFFIGYFVNPNSLIFSLPVLFYVFLQNWRELKFYIYSFLGMIPGVIVSYFAHNFYTKYPEYAAHKMWKLKFSFESLFDRISNLDFYFQNLTPFYFKGHWLVILLLFVLAIYLFRNNRKEGFMAFFSVFFIICSLGINKLDDYVFSIFLSPSRMYLAIPLLLALLVFWSFKGIINLKKVNWILVLVSILFVGYKFSKAESTINYHTKSIYHGRVCIISIDELKSRVNELNEKMKGNKVDLIIFVPSSGYAYTEMALLAYGAPFMIKDFPITNIIHYERRSWIFLNEKTKVRDNVLLFNSSLGIKPDLSGMNTEVLDLTPDILLIKENNKNALELSEIFKFQYNRI